MAKDPGADRKNSVFKTSRQMTRMILESVSSEFVKSKQDLEQLMSCCFSDPANNLEQELSTLNELKLISVNQEDKVVPTQLGRAVLASSLSPTVAIRIFSDLQMAMRAICLDSELHMLYLVTPIDNLAINANAIDWNLFHQTWAELPEGLAHVAKLVGITEKFFMQKMGGKVFARNDEALNMHIRFFAALVLHELINENPLEKVAHRFKINRGLLQALQQQAATYAYMVVSFCDRLGWFYLKTLLEGFAERLQFGIRRDLTELIRVDGIDAIRARTFHQYGIKSLVALANSTVEDICRVLRKAVAIPFAKKMNQIQANYASDGSDSDEVVSQSRKRKAYSTDWKLEVVKFANEVSVHAASKKYKIDRQNVRQWKNNVKKLLLLKESSTAGKGKKRLPGGGRQLSFKELDNELAKWVREQRQKKFKVSRQIIQRQAEKMFNTEEEGTEHPNADQNKNTWLFGEPAIEDTKAAKILIERATHEIKLQLESMELPESLRKEKLFRDESLMSSKWLTDDDSRLTTSTMKHRSHMEELYEHQPDEENKPPKKGQMSNLALQTTPTIKTLKKKWSERVSGGSTPVKVKAFASPLAKKSTSVFNKDNLKFEFICK
uniref:HTH CENPB-type domain-containing protein n=1 Tax=Ditylenchus dipsaci TaxID=166011 RepID=A0A915DK68_9BILA